MYTFAQKQNQPQKVASFNIRRQNQAPFSKSHQLSSTQNLQPPLLDLQRTVGNQATQRLLMQTKPDGIENPSYIEEITPFDYNFSQIPIYSKSKSPSNIHAKLAVNTPRDIYEQEADRIADQVMAAPAHSAMSDASPYIQRYLEREATGVDTMPSSVDHVLANPGRPLDPTLQYEMEQRFGYDFSRVRVHSGPAAEQSAWDVNANAYTVGRNIVFGAGRYEPGTQEGKRLIAHELAHVLQQSNSQAVAIPRQILNTQENQFRGNIGFNRYHSCCSPNSFDPKHISLSKVPSVLIQRKDPVTDATERMLRDFFLGDEYYIKIFESDHPWTQKMKNHPHMESVRKNIKYRLEEYCWFKAGLLLKAPPLLEEDDFSLNALSLSENLEWLRRDILSWLSFGTIGTDPAFRFGSFRLEWEILNPRCSGAPIRSVTATVSFKASDILHVGSALRIPKTKSRLLPIPDNPFRELYSVGGMPLNDIIIKWHWAEKFNVVFNQPI